MQKSLVPGVYWRDSFNKWVVSFRTKGTHVYLGCFTDLLEAEAVTLEYRQKHGLNKLDSNWVTYEDDYAVLNIRRLDGEIVQTKFDAAHIAVVNSRLWSVSVAPSGAYVIPAGMSKQRPGLARIIMGEPVGMEVDHINGDTLDNREANLRVVTRGQNLQNIQGAYQNNKSSGIRGVTWLKRDQKWQAHAQLNKKKHTIGTFHRLEDAAEAVQEWRRQNMPYSNMDQTEIVPCPY